ncbi:AI-2E family transporter [Thermomonospora umbrina]|uniref:Putative PurR-regulated permease PerM n=1 Tax=Thermomonospora umbrina TaxID=111806 RepID=A0A3D9SUP5_9ACTN|nr:AI-2E family transporter [Thermomonospora umbrina]REE97753.1 putative PurR-regulated permease PerM [Thermomonospora umbrina]
MNRGGPASVPPGLRSAALVTACLLVIATAVYLVVQVLVDLAPLTLAIVAALLMTALVGPVPHGVRRLGGPAWLGALVGLATLLAAVGLPLALVGNRVVTQWSSLSRQTNEGLGRVRDYLLDGPLPVSERQLDALVHGLSTAARRAAPDPVGTAETASQAVGALLISLLLTFFLLKDGPQMTRWLLDLAPERHRTTVAEAAQAGWRTLVSYIRGTFVIAGVDAAGIGVGLALIGVPLALPLALLTFVAAFVPIVGATVAGAVAVLVALVGNGVTDALLALAVVIGVQQLEGHLLQPLIMGRALRLHPAVILVTVMAGTLLGGVAGAVVAVPIVAIAYRVTRSIQGRDASGSHPTPDVG